ncbi:TonB dependent receptor [anaerobic digester metagenome]
MNKHCIEGREPLNNLKHVLKIMRITLSFLFFCILFSSASNSYSQEFTVKSKTASIKEVCKEIEKGSDYVFIFSDNCEKLIDKQVNVEANSKDVTEVLNAVLSSTGLTYKILDKQIVVYKSTESAPSVAVEQPDINIIQQPAKKQITGKVVDAQGDAIIGANIIETGTTNGTVTDIDGKFSLNVENNSYINISYIGYLEQSIATEGRSVFNITLLEDTKALDEVVVVGYGTMRKSDLTGSVVSANIDAFTESPNLNIMQSLQGSVPGVQIGQTNETGQEPSIQIRGVNTIGGNRSPLIVVDEIIYEGRIGDINPNDIKSVEVLKDVSSKAIYGSQASNGVILITTKSGNLSEKPIIKYSGSISFQNPTVNARLLNREENLERIKGIYYERAYLGPDYTTPNPNFNFRNDTELVPNLLDGIDNNVDFDWYGELTSTGKIHDHILSINGGTQKTTYYISGGYSKNEGFVINDQYERFTTRISITNVINNWLKIGVNASGAFTDFSGLGPGAFYATSPFVTPYDENGELLLYPKGASTTHVNPLLNVQADHKNKGNQITGNFFGEIKIPQIEGLKYRINYNRSLAWSENSLGNPYGENLSGSVSKRHYFRSAETLDNIFSYENTLENHRFGGTFVYGYKKLNNDQTEAVGKNVPNIALSYDNLQQALVQEIYSGASKESSLYQMTRFNYSYKDRYLFTSTYRRDGFSGFAKNNKFATFPSAGIAWVLTNEPFFKVKNVNNLKLRASYGQNGNQTSRYSSLARVATSDDYRYVFGDGGASILGQSLVSLANEDLSWEKTTGMNYGIDFAFFNNRITGNVEYYKTTTTDLLWDMVIPRVTGFNSIKTNVGEVANSGFEFYVEATPFKSDDFSWDFGINFSTNKNKVISLLGLDRDGDGKEDDLIASNLFIGKSLGAIYDYELDGIWQIGDDVPKGYYPGNYRIVDQDGDGKITADKDRVFLGKTEPAYLLGFQNNLIYKNFSFRFFVNTIQGGKDGYLGRQFEDSGNSTGNFANANYFTFLDHWSVTNPDAKYSVWYRSPQINPAQYCSRSFVRLQDISLAYNLEKSVLKKIGLYGLKLYVSGKNLLTFSNWDGWDPETNQGIQSTYYPVMKSITFGVDIEF